MVTADFVKVYDLADDAISPQYYFLLPSAKIRDATFVCGGGGGGGDAAADRHLLLMSAAGHVYTQPMDAASHAQHGPFYITNVLPVWHPDVQVRGARGARGGVERGRGGEGARGQESTQLYRPCVSAAVKCLHKPL